MSTIPAAAGSFPVFNLSGLNGTNGFRIDGVSRLADSGTSFASADVNGNRIADLIIRAPYAGPNGTLYAGSTYVVFGRK